MIVHIADAMQYDAVNADRNVGQKGYRMDTEYPATLNLQEQWYLRPVLLRFF